MRSLIRLYQLTVSPVLAGLGCQCRYYPSCSEFAWQQFAEQPFFTALVATMYRIWSCRP